MKKLLTFFLTALLTFSVSWADEVTYTFNSVAWGASPENWSGTANANQYSSTQNPIGVQVTTGKQGMTVTSPTSYNNISKIVVTYTSTSRGVGTIKVSVGNSEIGTQSIAKSQSQKDLTYNVNNLSGSVSFVPYCTTNSYSINSITITYNPGGTPAADNWYRKVTDLSDLVAGKKCIFVYENGSSSAAMGALDSNDYGTGITGLSITDNRINIGGTAVVEYTLGSSSNAWTFLNPDNRYLGAEGDKFSTSATLNGYTDLRWTVNSSGYILNNSSNRFIRCSSTPIFGLYTSGTYATIFVQDLEDCATPTFSPNPENGPFTGEQSVTISCDTPGATIYYTTDGTTPTTSSAVYSSAIPVNSTTTIKAIAEASGYNNSEVATAEYVITAPAAMVTYQKITSTSDLTDGKYLIVYEGESVAFDGSLSSLDDSYNTKNVTISSNEIVTNEDFYFTYDATNHTLRSASGYYIGKTANSNGMDFNPTTTYTNTITFDNGNAVITASGGCTLRYNSASDQKRFRYYKSGQQAIQLYKEVTPTTPKVAKPTFTPPAGTYTSTQSVTISCDTPGATIYYTTNGDTPTTSSSVYSSAISVASNMTIKAFAVLTDYDDSEVATAEYTIDLTPTLTATPSTVNINDDNTSGAKTGSFTVTGSNIGSDNVGVDVLWGNFSRYAGSQGWGFDNNNGSVSGTAYVTYTGKALGAHGRVQASNNLPISATVDVNYLYTGPIYIMGDVNSTGFAPNNGVLMDHDTSTNGYSKTLTLLDNNNDGYAYISFTKALANTANDWDGIKDYRFGPESNGDWGFQEQFVNQPCALDTTGGYYSIKLPAGEWVVSILPATNKFVLVPHVSAPVFDPAGGRYETSQEVEITCTNGDAHIYYTTDGTTPSANNGTLYTGPITVSAESTTLKAIAIYGNYSSAVTEATYTIKAFGENDFILVESTDDITAGDEYVLVCTRTSGATAGNYAMTNDFNSSYYSTTQSGFSLADKVVTLGDPTTVNVLTFEEADADNGLFFIKDDEGNYLYYPNNTNSNAVYRGSKENTAAYMWSISINEDNNNKEIVILNSGTTRYLLANPSATRYACYTNTSTSAFYPKLYKKVTSSVPAPTITPAGGAGNKRFESIQVTITATDENYTIYYTTDGSAPTINSTEYTAPFTLPYGSAPTTVKAIAVDGDGNVSRPTTVVYYWDRATVSITPVSGEVTGNVNNVTITATPSDATVTYTINGGAPQTYDQPFTVPVNEDNSPVTVEATATKGASTATASVTYTFKDGGVNSIAEYLALENNEERFFKNPVVVLFDYSQNNGAQDYIWIKDRSGYMKLFIQPGFDSSSKPRYNNGDVIPPGFTVKKILYTEHGASFIEGKSTDPSIDNFALPTERALADPEQVKLSELLANPALYNDRYLYINKLEVTGYQSPNYSVASDENGDGVSEISGNNVIIYNKFPTWKEKDGTLHTVNIPDADGTYYNVTFIFQQYGNVYEIMPVEFTEWHENKVRLEDLVEIDVTTPNEEYTISNDLIAAKVTWDDNHKKFAIFAKDDEAYAKEKRLDPTGKEEYLIRYETPTFINEVAQKDYDQSNWVEILISSDITSKQDGLYQSQLESLQENYENKILKGGTVRGTYVDDLNPTIMLASNATLEVDDVSSSYDPNIFCTANFVMENLGPNGAVSYNQDNDGTYFMMDAKPQEFCMVVWAYYEGGANNNYFVIPMPEGAEINGHGFHGSFLADMSLCEDIYGLESAAVNKGTSVASCFKASDDESYGSQQMLYGFKAIVRKNPDYWNAQGGNGAPSRIQPYSEADGNAKEGNPAYKVYPMSVGSSSSGNVTDVNEVNAIKEVVSVRYYNVMGMESEKPFEGINIVVTRYSDGSASTVKVLR